MVVAVVLKVVQLKFAYLGHLAYKVGWKYHAVTAALEKRKEKVKVHYRKKKQIMRLWNRLKRM